jgi:hypothetical protein
MGKLAVAVKLLHLFVPSVTMALVSICFNGIAKVRGSIPSALPPGQPQKHKSDTTDLLASPDKAGYQIA